MTDESGPADFVPTPFGTVRKFWEVTEEDAIAASELCGNTTVCRNMKDVTFEDMVGQGSDLRSAWRQQLERDGKLNSSAVTLGKLVESVER